MKKSITKAFILAAILFASTISANSKTDSATITNRLNLEQQQDSIFSQPFIDVEEWRDAPIKHLYVHGGFKDSDTKFSFYFPEKENYKNRFFQYITPVPDSENLSQNNEGGEADKIHFAISHGAYFVETNGGGADAGIMARDKTIGAYKANAAAAQYSKVKAEEIYGKHRTYGYAYGGSGGAYRTVGAAENTSGVWDGSVPFVLGSPMAIPNVFSVRMHAMRILKDKLPQIVDAIEPGGSGDMYAGLNEEEKAALKEVTAMGFPIKSWFNYKNMGIHAFPAIYGGMRMADGAYFNDFWTKPGYLGFDNPESLAKDRLQEKVIVKKIITKKIAFEMGLEIGHTPGVPRGSADAAWKNLDKKADTIPIAFQMTTKLPNIQFLGGELIVQSGANKGKDLAVKSIAGDLVVLGQSDPTISSQIKEGDDVKIDNSNYLAAQTYHRHQVPGPEYSVWNQFRKTDNSPIYPQRPMIIGPMFTQHTVGSLPSGKFDGKMILVESLWDTEAYPWQADWYRARVKEQLSDSIDNKFRLYFTDHANHADYKNPGDPTHYVSYIGVLQQALLDLSAWVENGIEPPANTNYEVNEGQVVIPNGAENRKGMQPVIDLNIGGKQRSDIKKGHSVNFTATIEVPENTGKIVSAEWDFEGDGTFSNKENMDGSKSALSIKAKHTYKKPGTYFVTLCVASQREGNTKTVFTLIRNLERVRVVVK